MNAAVWIYLVVTLGAILWLSWHYALAVESTRWPRVSGKILKAWVQKEEDEYTSYYPRVEYEYQAEGLRRRSSSIWLTGDKSMWPGSARRFVAAFHPGEAVDVWYDPNKPDRSTLRPGGALRLMAILVAVSIIGPGLAIAFSDEGRRILAKMGVIIQ